jgi:hypothetical protein
MPPFGTRMSSPAAFARWKVCLEGKSTATDSDLKKFRCTETSIKAGRKGKGFREGGVLRACLVFQFWKTDIALKDSRGAEQ